MLSFPQEEPDAPGVFAEPVPGGLLIGGGLSHPPAIVDVTGAPVAAAGRNINSQPTVAITVGSGAMPNTWASISGRPCNNTIHG